MIWFFLAGFISGAVGAVMLIWGWIKSHVKQVSKEEMMRSLAETERILRDKAGREDEYNG